MKLNNKQAEFFVPDSICISEAISRTTHMAIGAHQDDVEIMAYDGIQKCFGCDNKWFFAVVATNGAGSSRSGIYKNYSDEEMQRVRRKEQKKAAIVGEYGALALLDYSSSAVKNPSNSELVEDIKSLIIEAKPEVIYTHNLADKHDTHVGVAIKVIKAIRSLPKELRPKKVFGCEVWRKLDWLNDDEKVVFDVSGHQNIEAAILGVFDSQISGGKRYDLATSGNRLSNATYSTIHEVDMASAVIYGMDLTLLTDDENIDIVEYIRGYVQRFEKDIENRIGRML